MFSNIAITFSSVLLASSALAVPTPQSTSTPSPAASFELISQHSGNSEVHLRVINANSNGFYIGKPTKSYCPSGLLPGSCPPGNETVVTSYNDQGTLYMDVNVPGGQQVYIDPDTGALAYTVAHSHFVPNGASTTDFTYTPPVSQGYTGRLEIPQGFVACPAGEKGVYQIFAAISGIDFTKCIGIVAGASPFNGSGAWQYD